MIDSLLVSLGAVCAQLLPILGALALVFLCIVLKRLADVMGELTRTVKNLDPAVKSVNDSMVKIQAPLDTVVKYSHTLDDVHDKTVDSVGKVAESLSDSVEKVKDFVVEKIKDVDPYDEVRPASEEEIQEAK
ncbi:MAG: hypothetical protein IKE28_05130 [Solobacterium sp.]|nr:hypothetical protein [Solobacterium sp.]